VTAVAVTSPVTDAALRLVRSLDRPVGDAARPPGPTPAPASFYPYAVVYTGTPLLRGNLLNPKEDGLHRIHVAVVGRTRSSADALRDQIRELLCDVTAWSIDGHAVVNTEHADSPDIFRDDDVSPPLFNAVTVVNVWATPDGTGS
jgi:hypothetical protein